jgi:hypothetical protein
MPLLGIDKVHVGWELLGYLVVPALGMNKPIITTNRLMIENKE